MERFNFWLKNKFQRWLGISDMKINIQSLSRMSSDAMNVIDKLDKRTTDLVSIGVDVHFKEPHMILIYSRLNGGQIREISASFKDIRELQQCVEELKYKYGAKSVVYDKPNGMDWLK